MKAVAETIGMQEFSDEHFRLYVLAFDLAHVVTPRFLIMHICHGVKLGQYSLGKDAGIYHTSSAQAHDRAEHY